MTLDGPNLGFTEKSFKVTIEKTIKELKSSIFKALNYITITIIQQIQNKNRKKSTKIFKEEKYSNSPKKSLDGLNCQVKIAEGINSKLENK